MLTVAPDAVETFLIPQILKFFQQYLWGEGGGDMRDKYIL